MVGEQKYLKSPVEMDTVNSTELHFLSYKAWRLPQVDIEIQVNVQFFLATQY